jgi:hypothetical protein
MSHSSKSKPLASGRKAPGDYRLFYWESRRFPCYRRSSVAITQSPCLLVTQDKPYQQDLGPDRFSLSSVVAENGTPTLIPGPRRQGIWSTALRGVGLEMNGTWFPWSGYFWRRDELPGNRFAVRNF